MRRHWLQLSVLLLVTGELGFPGVVAWVPVGAAPAL